MKLNKTLVSALVLSAVLTGCNNMVENENTANDENAPVVEEKAAETTEENVDAEEAADEEAKEDQVEESTDAEEDADNDEEEAESAEADEKETTSSTANLSTEEKIEAIEQAIFDNRSSARAVELLFELSPETANEHADVLNELLENSNSLLDQAQTALEELKAQ